MEWKTPYKPKQGDHRERLKFAWLPTKCEDGRTRWLCKIRVLELYKEGLEMISGFSRARWETVRTYRAEVEI